MFANIYLLCVRLAYMNKLTKKPLKNIYLTISGLSISKKNWHVKKRGVFPPEFWHHIHCPPSAPLGCSKGNTTAVGRATTEDIESGWAGHRTEREQKEIFFGLEKSQPALQVETNRAQLFNLQWSRCWQLRALKGWTPLAALELKMLVQQHEYSDETFDRFGAPHWWTLSQSG